MTDRQRRYLSLFGAFLFVVIWTLLTAAMTYEPECGAYSEMVEGVCYAR